MSWMISPNREYRCRARAAFRSTYKKAKPQILEPVMKVEVITPEEFTGEVIGDLSSRRGNIEGMSPRSGGVTAVTGLVPLSEMFGYATDLRSATQVRATFTMEFDHYAVTPSNISEEVIKKAQG